MEDILASIKRIIADDAPGAPRTLPPPPSIAAVPAPPAAPAQQPMTIPAHTLHDRAMDDSILELTNPAPSIAQPTERPADRFRQAVASARVGAARPAPEAAPQPRIAPSLAAPSIAPQPAPAPAQTTAAPQPSAAAVSTTVEALVRGLVSDWLAANLPTITERLVREEIARIRDAED